MLRWASPLPWTQEPTEVEAASGPGSSRGISSPGFHLIAPFPWTSPILWGAAREGLSAGQGLGEAVPVWQLGLPWEWGRGSGNRVSLMAVFSPTQNGNITELLLKEGFARCVDWSMAVYTRGAEKLRAAER